MSRKIFLTSAFVHAFMIMLTLGGCAVEKPQYFPFPDKLQSLSGVLLESEGSFWFQPCYERLWWPVQDLTVDHEIADIYHQFTPLGREAIYVELQGAVDVSQNYQLLVKTLDTVGGTRQTCHFSLEGLEYRAASSKPVWVADITARQILVKSASPPGSYNFYTVNSKDADNDTTASGKTDAENSVENEAEQSSAGSKGADTDNNTAVNAEPEADKSSITDKLPKTKRNRQVYTPSGSDDVIDDDDTADARDVVALYRQRFVSDNPFQIKIIQERCTDSVTGTLLPFTAEMRFYGHLYSGCARKGRSLNRDIKGYYWYQPPGKPQIMFKLSADQRVQLVTRNSQGKTVTERGRWQKLDSGKLVFSMRDAMQKEYLMLFVREPDGRLILQTGSEHLVSLGTAFRLWRPSGLEGGQLMIRVKPENKPAESVPATAEADAVVEESSLPGESSSTLTESVLPDAQIQPADIDAELLNEIMVNDGDPGSRPATGPENKP